MNVAWSQLTPAEFEQLCGLILEANKFTDIQWFGQSGGDKGRDILARKIEHPLSSIERSASWIVQCKRYVSKPPRKEDIASFLTAAREHRPDNVLIMVTNTLSAQTKDWLDSVRRDYPFQIYLWEERDLLREIAAHKRQLSERLPKIYSQAEPILIYEVHSGEYVFSCDEFELSIVAFNKLDEEEAREEVVEFIKFLQQNDVDFTWLQSRKRRRT